MREQIVEIIKSAGVVGAGGAGLPTHIKADASVDTVLVNGASCEPLLMSDPYLLEHETDTVVRGLEALLECSGAQKGIICLKSKHGGAVAAVRAAVERNSNSNLEVFELRDFYPAGDEHVLVHEVLGRTVPERGIPLQVGAVVSNVESLYNVALAMDGVPTTERYVTVTGEIANRMVVKVPIGTKVADVLEFAGGPTISKFKVVDGGPMMGRVLSDLEQTVTKTTSGLIVLPPDHNVVARKIMEPERVRKITNTICCQCSQCTDLCPRNLLGHTLHPHKLMRIMDSQILSSEVAKEALLCSECGLCEKFACPMMVSPREVNAQLKQKLMQEGISWDATGESPAPHPFRGSRYVATSRLIQRLNLTRYDTHPVYAGEFIPTAVSISLKQHIGAIADSIVSAGHTVKKGDLIGEIPEGAMGARIHASIDGVVGSVANGNVTIIAS